MKVAIIGAAIGGLTVALLLHQRGIDAEVWEAVSEVKPLGAGINLLPHAVKELAGFDPQVLQAAARQRKQSKQHGS